MKTGRNEKCHCGSGLKYKNCCMRKDEANELQESQVRAEKNFEKQSREILALLSMANQKELTVIWEGPKFKQAMTPDRDFVISEFKKWSSDMEGSLNPHHLKEFNWNGAKLAKILMEDAHGVFEVYVGKFGKKYFHFLPGIKKGNDLLYRMGKFRTFLNAEALQWEYEYCPKFMKVVESL